MKPNHIILAALLFAYCMSLYPAVLASTERKGTDAPIYYQAGQGNTEYIATDYGRNVQYIGWVYSDHLLPPLQLLAKLPYRWFLLAIHLGNSIGLAFLFVAACKLNRFPVAGVLAAFLVGNSASDVIANGNITGILCGLSLTPWGALLACAVKPYYAVAVVLHAAHWSHKRRAGNRRVTVA